MQSNMRFRQRKGQFNEASYPPPNRIGSRKQHTLIIHIINSEQKHIQITAT